VTLILCRECKREISSEAISCPHCGCPLPSGEKEKGWKFPGWGMPFSYSRGFEWKSKTTLFRLPLIHIAIGWDMDLKEGRWQIRFRVAKGIIAIGQFAFGVITIAQFGIGLLFGLGQFIFSLVAVAQLAFGIILGIGQIATGYIAIGQFVLIAYYGLAQKGNAVYLWSMLRKDTEAVEFFRRLGKSIGFLGK